jgi:hypothetical protein
MIPDNVISGAKLLEMAAKAAPEGVDPNAVAFGIAMAITPPEELVLPVEQDLLHWGKVIYAWHEEDASATDLALEVLPHILGVFKPGPEGLISLGVSLKELVAFLVNLHRHRVRIADPLKIAVLLKLRDSDAGLTASQIAKRLPAIEGHNAPPSVLDVEAALHALENEKAKSGPKPLVRADGAIWKSLV